VNLKNLKQTISDSNLLNEKKKMPNVNESLLLSTVYRSPNLSNLNLIDDPIEMDYTDSDSIILVENTNTSSNQLYVSALEDFDTSQQNESTDHEIKNGSESKKRKIFNREIDSLIIDNYKPFNEIESLSKSRRSRSNKTKIEEKEKEEQENIALLLYNGKLSYFY
jgi:hypothetical protein